MLAWGANYDGQTNVPVGLTNVVAISAGNNFAVALRIDGTITAWGDSSAANDTNYLENVVAISAGLGSALNLRADGSIVASFSQATTNQLLYPSSNKIIGIAEGLFLLNDQTLTGSYGNSFDNFDVITLPNGPLFGTSIAGNIEAGAAVSPNGTVSLWTTIVTGQTIPDYSVPLDLTNAVEVDLGREYGIVRTADQRVRVWRFGGGNSEITTNLPTGLTNIIQISAGDYHALALKSDGRVMTWGSTWDGVGNVPTTATNVLAVAAGGGFSVALTGSGPPEVNILNATTNEVSAGRTSILRGGFLGEPPLSIQWRKNGANIVGATNATLWLTNSQMEDTGSYSLFASNRLGTATSQEVAVVVTSAPPAFVSEPISQLATLMNRHELSATVAGSEPMHYQWHFNGKSIPGATNAVLRLDPLHYSDSGDYSVVVTNALGTATSSNAALALTSVVLANNAKPDVRPMPIGLTNAVSLVANSLRGNVLALDGKAQDWDLYSRGYPYVASLTVSNLLELGDGWTGSAISRENHVVSLYTSDITKYEIPYGLTNAIWITAGLNTRFALLSDGRLTGWFVTQFGTAVPLTIPTEVSNVVDFSFGFDHGIAIRADRSVVTWGDLDFGNLNVPVSVTNVIAVAAGDNFSVAVRGDGSVVSWGRGINMLYGGGETNIPSGLSNVVSVKAGRSHTAALKRDGTVAVWGFAMDRASNAFSKIKNVAKIAAGELQTAALFWENPPLIRQLTPRESTIFSGGPAVLRVDVLGPADLRFQWQLHGTNIPGAIDKFLFVENIRAEDSDGYSFIASSPSGASVGESLRIRVENAPPFVVTQPVDTGTNVTRSATFTVAADGAKPLHYQWMHEGVDIPGATMSSLTVGPLTHLNAGHYSVRVTNPFGSTISSNAALKVWSVVGWGRTFPYDYGQSNAGPASSDAFAISAGEFHSAAIKLDGTVTVWGNMTNVPAGLSNVVELHACGTFGQPGSYNLALLSDGTIGGWNNDTIRDFRILSFVSNAVGLVSRDGYNVAIQADGRVKAWAGFTGPVATNIPISATNITRIAFNVGSHYLALRRDGTVVTWGSTSAILTNLPAGLTNIVAVAAGPSYSCALRDDGTVISWGSPMPNASALLPTLTNVLSIVGGERHIVALRNDGTIVSWGENSHGQTNVPPGLTNIVNIGAGRDYSWALTGNGKLFVWGDNSGGQNSVPPALTNVISVSHGVDHCLALTGPSEPRIRSVTSSRSQPYSGEITFLRADAIGMPPLSYQWHLNGIPIHGENNPSLLLPNPDSQHSGSYSVTVTNLHGTASATIDLAVLENPPIITIPPAPVWTFFTSNAVFSAKSKGSQPILYQWFYGDEPIEKATNSTLIITNIHHHMTNLVKVMLSNAFGVVFSEEVGIKVSPIIAWGANNYGQTLPPPATASNVVGLAAGLYHGVALKDDGSLVSWGLTTNYFPLGVSNVAQISVSDSHTAVLQRDGTVKIWVTPSDSLGHQISTVPPTATNVVEVVAGYSFTMALRRDGTVVAWGRTSGGTNVPPGISNVVAIAAPRSQGTYGLALKQDGTVVAWGYPSDPTNVPTNLRDVTAIASTRLTAFAVKSDGTVVGWRSTGLVPVPQACTNVHAIAAGDQLILALRRDGTLISFSDSFGTLYPFIPNGISNIVDIAVGGSFSMAHMSEAPPFIRRLTTSEQSRFSGQELRLAVDARGNLPLHYQWQLNGTNINGATNSSLYFPKTTTHENGIFTVVITNERGTVESEAVPVTIVDQAPIIVAQPFFGEVDVLQSTNFLVHATGSLPMAFQWVKDGEKVSDETNNLLKVTAFSRPEVRNYQLLVSNSFGFSASSNISFRVRPVSSWGLGVGGETNTPQGVFALLALSAGAKHTLGLTTDGKVIAWGSNGAGETNVPDGLSSVAAIYAGWSNSIALKIDGSLVAWGMNAELTPRISNAVSIAMGPSHTLAILSDGRVVGWGDNTYGQIGVPADLRDVVHVAAGIRYSIALKKNGELVMWGSTNTYDAPPTGLSDIVQLSSVGNSTFAVRSNGAVVGWGWAPSGETNVPPNITNAIAISTGPGFVLALRQDGTVTSWGSSSSSRVRRIPTGLTNVIGVSAIGGHAAALVFDPTPAKWPISVQRERETVRVSVPGLYGRFYILERADDLSFRQSEEVSRERGRTGIVILKDEAPSRTQIFYRIRRE